MKKVHTSFRDEVIDVFLDDIPDVIYIMHLKHKIDIKDIGENKSIDIIIRNYGWWWVFGCFQRHYGV